MATTTQGILMGRRTGFLTKWLPRHPSPHIVKENRTAGQEWEALPAGSQRTEGTKDVFKIFYSVGNLDFYFFLIEKKVSSEFTKK